MIDNAHEVDREETEAKAYSRQRLKCHLADMALDLLVLTLLAVVVAAPLDRWLATFWQLQSLSFRLIVFLLIVALVQYVLRFPLALYSGFFLEHRYGLSRQSWLRWLQRDLLKASVMLFFGLVVSLGLFWMIWRLESYWWLAAAAAAFVLSVLLGQLVPVLILPLFYRVERLDDADLLERFRLLADGTTLRIEGVYRMVLSEDTVKANAMLAGLGRTRRVILADTLLDHFSQDEIAVVLAHEVGHHVFRHIPKLILIGLVFSGVGLYLCDRVLAIWMRMHSATYADLPVAALPVLLLVLSVFSILFSPLSNTISRHFERQCDRYALQRTGLHEAYVAAFTKLAKQNKAEMHPHPWEVFLFHDHPAIADRLAMARPTVTSESVL